MKYLFFLSVIFSQLACAQTAIVPAPAIIINQGEVRWLEFVIPKEPSSWRVTSLT